MAIAKALIVDDHEALTDNLVEILESGLEELEMQCRVERTVGEAISAAEPDLDLALVDLHLPDGPGTSLIDELKRRAPFAQVVIITGDATVESAISAMDRGAFSYVLKPFNPPELLERVHRAVEHARLLRDREALRVQLERSEQRHRDVIESVPAFVLALDHDGNILLWNRRLEEVTGHAREQMLGKPGLSFVGDSETGDVRLPIRGGGHRLVRWQKAEDHPGAGNAPYTFAVGVDVTEEREMQRRAVLSERLAAIGTLAAGLAHEVRNPLNSASLQLQVLERRIARGETKADKLRPVVTIVHDEIRRLARLVSDFLAFARPAVIDVRAVEVNELITRVAALIRPECESASIDLVLELSPDVRIIQADEERLRQVFLNILRNAAEAIREKGRIVVATHPADDQGNVKIVVEDDGPGIPEGAPVFDAFYTSKEQGTGLGLAIVHSIIGEHGGSVSVESQPGRTRFEVLLPEPSTEPRSTLGRVAGAGAGR